MALADAFATAGGSLSIDGAARSKRGEILALLATLALTGASCRRGPAAPAKAQYDASDAAELALELFDANGDGSLDDDELLRSPGLAEGKTRADTDGDGRLSADEIATRIQGWLDSRRSVVVSALEFTQGRRPLAGVEVRLEPEPFLSDWLDEAQSTTNNFGQASPANTEIPGTLHMGYYRVKVSSPDGRRRIPERYNEQTELGVEICPDRPEEDLTIRFQMGRR